MWYQYAGPIKGDYALNNRRYGWVLNERKQGNPTIEDCRVDNFGWVMFSLWLAITDDGWSYHVWENSYHLALIDGEKLIEIYTLTGDEFHDHPGLPAGWTIPF